MKKILLLCIVIAASFTGQAQTSKGDWLVGGGFRLNTSDNTTEISLTPNAGVFAIDKLAVGGNVMLSYSKNGTRRTTDFGIGPWVRYYFTNANVRPILHGYLNILTENTKIGSASSTNSGNNYFLGGGAAIFISNQVSIDGLMGYYHSKVDGFDGSGGFALSIGFQVYLLKKQMDKVRGK